MNTIKKMTLLLIPMLLILSCTTTSINRGEENQFRLKSFSVFDGKENLIQSISILYNEINKPVEVLSTAADGEVYNRKTLEYTDSGKISSVENAMDISSSVRTEYFYNASDFLIKVVTRNSDGTILGENSYINDGRGNPVDWVSEYPGSNERVHFIMEYDEQDRMVKSSELDEHNNVIYYSVSQYDESGNESSYTIFSPRGDIDQQMLNFYRASQLIRTEVKDERGNLLFHTEYDLNDSDRPIKISSYNQYEDLTNWIDLQLSASGEELIRKSYDFDGNLQEIIEKEYDVNGNIHALRFYDDKEELVSITRNTYEKGDLNMSEKEFNALVFKL